MLTFSFSGADGVMSVPETLTAGMVGKEAAFYFSREWVSLGKVAVFTAGSVTKDVPVIGDRVAIPWEVLQKPMQVLYVGVYGVGNNGTVVTPTIRAKGPLILPGADPSDDPALEATPALWEQVMAEIGELGELLDQNQQLQGNQLGQLRQEIQTEIQQASDSLEETISQTRNNLQGQITQTKTELEAQMYQLSGDMEQRIGNLTLQMNQSIGQEVKSLLITILEKAAYIDNVSRMLEDMKELWVGDSGDSHVHSYAITVTQAPTCVAAGVRTYTCSCGHSYEEVIPMLGHTFVDGICVNCGTQDSGYVPVVSLTEIQAVYSGGPVAEDTSLDELDRLAVTAYYSDGTSGEVEGYTLSGQIIEGTNTITVTYEGCQTTFTVEGFRESGRRVLHNWDLTASLTDSVGNLTATLGGTAAQNENGLTLDSDNASCYFGSSLFLPNRTIEIDVGEVNFSGASRHGFFVMNKTSAGANSTGTEGLTFRYSNGPYSWQLYVCYLWQTMESSFADGNFMANRTLKFTITSSMVFAVYLDDILLGTSNNTTAHGTELQIGSSSKAFSNVTVRAVRIYEEG